MDVLIPFFPKFKRMPGAIFIDFLILNPITVYLVLFIIFTNVGSTKYNYLKFWRLMKMGVALMC